MSNSLKSFSLKALILLGELRESSNYQPRVLRVLVNEEIISKLSTLGMLLLVVAAHLYRILPP